MKVLKLVVAVIGVTLLFASCKTNMDLTKRHYTKGYYFHKTKSPEQPSAREGTASTTTKETTTDLAKAEVSLTNAAQKNVELKKNDRSQKSVFPGFSHSETNSIHNGKGELNSSADTKKNSGLKTGSVIQKKSADKSMNSRSSALSGGMLVLCVILCFFWFLNLIAVYIHDGSITMNFWITLLLDLIIIGGIIFSLLVVLDVVDLA